MNTCRRVSVLVSLWALLSSVPVAGQELQKIKIGYPAISYNQIHIWVAKEAGLFKKYGLDTELIFLRGGQMATQALVAGDPPLVNIGTVVQAVLQGHDLTLIAASENAYAYSVVAAPGVARIEQRPYPTLKGIQFLLDELSAELPQARGAKPEQFVDLSLLQELEREGFFAEMAQRYP